MNEIIKPLSEPKLPGWLTETEVQQLLGCCTTKLWQLRSKKILKSSKLGSKTFYKLNSILEYLEKNSK
ncbi:MAG TPA: helix-turn-helix domain-containing protein [Candidatus Paceibacterota bacterium]|nr:helix-turn-helix domain-containing protein [Candidatus Paceibacterota bacterium]